MAITAALVAYGFESFDLFRSQNWPSGQFVTLRSILVEE
jgi:hypothetical protein